MFYRKLYDILFLHESQLLCNCKLCPSLVLHFLDLNAWRQLGQNKLSSGPVDLEDTLALSAFPAPQFHNGSTYQVRDDSAHTASAG